MSSLPLQTLIMLVVTDIFMQNKNLCIYKMLTNKMSIALQVCRQPCVS